MVLVAVVVEKKRSKNKDGRFKSSKLAFSLYFYVLKKYSKVRTRLYHG